MNFLSLEKHNNNSSDYSKDKIYKSRKLISNAKPDFKLNAFCVNLKDKVSNFEFIKKEWKDFLNVRRFVALSSATKSHYYILDWICQNKEKIKFPIVVMEDDVYRKNNFLHYWNKILEQKNCDYIAFDNIFLQINKEDIQNNNDFVSIISHRSMGFIVYFKSFFDKYFKSKHLFNNLIPIKELGLVKTNRIPIDLYMTKLKIFKKCVPKRQVCRQIVDKTSTTAHKNTAYYNDYYNLSENILIEEFPKNEQ